MRKSMWRPIWGDKWFEWGLIVDVWVQCTKVNSILCCRCPMLAECFRSCRDARVRGTVYSARCTALSPVQTMDPEQSSSNRMENWSGHMSSVKCTHSYLVQTVLELQPSFIVNATLHTFTAVPIRHIIYTLSQRNDGNRKSGNFEWQSRPHTVWIVYSLPSMTICDKYSGWYAHILSLRSFTIFPLHLTTWTSRGFIVVVEVVVAMADVNGVPSRCVTSADDRLVNSWSWSSWSSTTPESSNDESRLPPPSLAFELAWRLVGSNCPR